MPVNLLQRALNQGIRESINEFDLDGARQALKYALSKKPDADTYYLASMLAETEKEKLKYLEKALDKDPFHEEAFAEYEHLAKQAALSNKTTQLPKKSKKSPKATSTNNWSAACYQLGYFIACGAGIAATLLGAPLIAVGTIVIVGGAGLGTIFKSVMAEHRITDTLMDETSENFRANSRGSSYVKKSTDFMQTTAGKTTTAVVVISFAATTLFSNSSSSLSNAFFCDAAPKGIPRGEIDPNFVKDYAYEVERSSCYSFDEWVKHRTELWGRSYDEEAQLACDIFFNTADEAPIKTQEIDGVKFFITGGPDPKEGDLGEGFTAINVDNYSEHCGN